MLQLVLKLVALALVALALAAGCTGRSSAGTPLLGECAQSCGSATPSPAATASPAADNARPASTAAPALAAPPASSTSTPGFAPATLAPSAASNGCVPAGTSSAALAVYERLSPAQLVGQLFMVGISSDDDLQASLAALDAGAIGNVVLYGGGWSSAAAVHQATTTIAADLGNNDGGVAPLIGGNQEGGAQGSFQAFYGPGFAPMPSALHQGALDTATLIADATRWGEQLLAAGVNLDLAPVLDVVDQATAQQNGPIGQYDREFGYDPATVAAHGLAFIAGMHAAGEPVAIKHFPGLGRVQGNTDFTAQSTTDASFSGANDPNLGPFKQAITAGTDMVMVGTASYPRFDPAPAAFSLAIVTDLLRGQIGFGGVVISDDLGAAASVADFTPADRALRFFAAGGDLLLTVDQADIAPMTSAVLSQMQTDPAVACRIQQSVLRVLTLKGRYGMLPQTPPASTPTGAPAQRATRGGR